MRSIHAAYLLALLSTLTARGASADQVAPAVPPGEVAPADAAVAPVPTTGKKKKKKPKVKISGVLSVLYKFRIDEDGDDQTDPDNFRLGKARVNFEGDLTDRIGYAIEVDPRSPTILGVVRDAYIAVRLIPLHEIRIGQQKTPWGYENRVSSTRLYTITRSELSEGIGRGVTLRDIGVAIVGKWPLAAGVRLEDALAVVNGAGLGVQDDDTTRKNVWGRVGVRVDLPAAEMVVRAGVSGAIGDQMGEADPGPPPVAAERFEFRKLGADVEVDQRWFFAAAEAAFERDEVPADSGDLEKSHAWYVEAAGKTPWQAGPVVRYDTWNAEEFKRLTIGGYWGLPDATTRVIVHYERFRDDAGRHDGRVLSMLQVRF